MGLQIPRALPVRVTLSVIAVGVFLLTMYAIGKWGLPAMETYDALFGLLSVLGIAIGGDTVRPSGTTFSVFQRNGEASRDSPP